jgi:outer membrane protein assembly factor BamB
MKHVLLFLTPVYLLLISLTATAQEGKIYAQTSDAKLYAVDGQTGKQLWLRSDMDGLKSTAPTVSNGLLYTSRYAKNEQGGQSYNLLALDAKTGQTKWELKLDPSGYVDESFACSPVVKDRVVYFGTKKDFYAVDAETGQKKWTRTGIGSWHSPTVYENTVFTVIASGRLVALSTATGATIWQSSLSRYHDGNPVVSASEKAVFIGTSTDSRNTYLTGFELATGAVKYDAVFRGNTIDKLILVKDRIVFSNTSYLYVVNIATKQTEYSRESTFAFQEPFVLNGILQIFDSNGPYLYDLNAKTVVEGPANKSVTLRSVYINDVVYGSLFDTQKRVFTLLAYDVKTGKDRWVSELAGRDLSASPVIAFDNGRTYYPPSSGMDEEYTTGGTGTPAATLTLSAEAKTVGQTGEVGSFTISSSSSWSAISGASWLHVSPATGTSTTSGVVSYTVDASTATASRVGSIIVRNTDALTKMFTVTQAGRPADVLTTTGPGSYTLARQGGSQSFSLTANNSWTITSSQPWLQVSPASGTAVSGATITLTAPNANTTTSPLQATLTARSGSLSRTITVVQDGQNFSNLPSSLTATGDGAVGSFTFTAARAWAIQNVPTWLTVRPTSGTAGLSGPVSYTISPNPTTGQRVVTLNLTDQTGLVGPSQLTVAQGSVLPIFAFSREITFTPASQTATLSLTANVGWQATTDANWISLPTTTIGPAGGATLAYSVAANTAPSSRTGVIALTGNWIDASGRTQQTTARYNVVQAPLVLAAEPVVLPGLLVQTYPNPAANWLTVRVLLDKAEPLRIGLFSATGRVIESRPVQLSAGEQTVSFDVRTLNAGQYLVVVENAAGRRVSRQVVKE